MAGAPLPTPQSPSMSAGGEEPLHDSNLDAEGEPDSQYTDPIGMRQIDRTGRAKRSEMVPSGCR